MSKLLENQVAIITGSGRGIGREAAILFAEHGARVVVSDIDQAPGEEVVSLIQKNGGEAISCCGDITAPDFAKNIVETSISTFGRIDIIVNNAGFANQKMFQNITDEEFQTQLDVHLLAPFRLIREAAPYIRDTAKIEIEQGVVHHRKIINVSSDAALGAAGLAHYSAAKSGLKGLTKSLAKEWGKFNVNTNAVAYGYIDTRLTRAKESGMGLSVTESALQTIPQTRMGTATEAAEAIFYLASPLSNYVNGQVLHVNGGLNT